MTRFRSHEKAGPPESPLQLPTALEPAPQVRLCYEQGTAELVGSTAAAFLCCSGLGYGHEQKRTSGAIVKPLLGSSSGPPPSTPLTGSRETSDEEGCQE
ncbi:hypothetical protein MRX96_056598 [Rhipicephalus microplus]